MEESRVIHEITPLMGKDALYIADRRKKEFTYPIKGVISCMTLDSSISLL